jgi:hypothetical protein
MDKIVFVGFDEPGSARRPEGLVDELVGLDRLRHPGIALQHQDREATEELRRGHLPEHHVVAMLSVWTTSADDPALHDVARRLAPRVAAYLVDETVPRWEADEPAPGAVTLTSLLHRPSSSSVQGFLDHWFDVHLPMSLRIHPQWTYVANVVSEALTPGAPAADAICEEGFRDVADVLDPTRFFGGDGGDWRANRRTIGIDVPLFVDQVRSVSTIMREERLRPLPVRG